MRAAHVFISMPVGGAEDIVLSLARTEHPGLEIVPVCLRELGVAGEEGAATGTPVTLLDAAPRKRFSPTGVWKLSRWLKEQRIDVVHPHVYNAHVYAVLAARLAGLPVVMHHHKTFNLGARRRRWLTLRLLSKFTAAQQSPCGQPCGQERPATRGQTARGGPDPPHRITAPGGPARS